MACRVPVVLYPIASSDQMRFLLLLQQVTRFQLTENMTRSLSATAEPVSVDVADDAAERSSCERSARQRTLHEL